MKARVMKARRVPNPAPVVTVPASRYAGAIVKGVEDDGLTPEQSWERVGELFGMDERLGVIRHFARSARMQSEFVNRFPRVVIDR